MAAKRSNPKREARIAKNNRNLNNALSLFTAGFIAEFYLLLINQYYVKGTIDQLVAVSYYLDAMIWVGVGVTVAGLVLTVMRKKWPHLSRLGRWVLLLGVFLAVSSLLMRKIYPAGTTAMCVLVPVVMLLGVVFLLYEREFAVQTAALTMTIAAAALLNHGSASMNGVVRAAGWIVLLLLAALLAATAALQKQEGRYRGMDIFSAKTNYALTYAVLALCIAAVALALLAGLAYYVIWGASIALFALAVFYTVKML